MNPDLFACYLCRDAPDGWIVPMNCPETPCDRRKEHAPHTFTARCACWLRRNADAIRVMKQDALAKGKSVPADCYALDDLEAGRYRWASVLRRSVA